MVIKDLPDWATQIALWEEQIPLEINIAAQDIPIDVKITESVTINVYIEGVDSGVIFNVNVTNSQLNVNIAAQDVDITVKNAVDANGNPIPIEVDITNATLDVNLMS